MESSQFDCGIVKRTSQDYKVTNLPETVGVNPSLLNAPIYVLHSTAGKRLDCIEVKWTQKIGGENVNKSFRFIRAATDPFPTVTHAKYLDILLAMFATNWNAEGVLQFRYCDVLKTAGKAPVSRAREAIQQTILRYHRHTTEWENSWNGKRDTLTFNIVRRSSIIDGDGNIKSKSPRRSIKKEDWHSIVFDEEIVNALDNDKRKRILLTDIFQKLKHDTFCVYRYYYGYPDYYIDEKGVKRDNIIWRNIETLSNIFKWTGQKNRFSNWLKDRIAELLELDLIDKPIWNGDALGIHCKNLKYLTNNDPKTTILTTSSNRTTKRNKSNEVLISKLSNEAVVSEYYARKSKNELTEEVYKPIDLLINNKMMDMAINLIKSQVLN